ncbi:MAG: bifunctional riboflavin kinase/FAD synthetase [Acidiferrobacterales bacterium]
MELIRGLHNLRPRHVGCVATIGNFDGVHLGHQAVLGQLVEKGQALALPTTVIVFEPQPMEVFRPGSVPPRLTRLREKLQALKRYSVDRVLCINFNEHFAQLSADDFIQHLLVDGLGVRYLVVGDDFRFGKGRSGNFAKLEQAGKDKEFQVVTMRTFAVDGERVSSTRVRVALEQGNLEQAEKLLGRPYRMCGRVAHGDKIGRTLGIPTANIFLHRKRSPLHGIFVVEVFGLECEPVWGAASIGSRPTVGGTRTLLEIHLLDFDDQIYGKHLQINFLHKIRDEEKYDTMDVLKARIMKDIEETRDWFAEHK